MIRLSAFADEADGSFEGQLAALKRNGIGYIELRGINGKNISDIGFSEAEVLKKMLDEEDIKVWSLASPIGKVNINDDFDAHLKKLEHLCRLTHIFGTDKIRMFSFFESYDHEDEVIRRLKVMTSLAKEYGVMLCLENEKFVFGDNIERVKKLLESVDDLYYVYDPANFVEVGEDSKNCLDSLHGKAYYFHIKDVIAETHETVPAGEGDGLIRELVRRIGDEDKVLSIEPHLMIFDGYSNFDSTEMKNKFHFTDNNEAFDAAVNALKAILKEETKWKQD